MNSNVDVLDKRSKSEYNRSSNVRYDANCPGIIELTFNGRKLYIALTGSIVNISTTGCLFSNERTPWSTMKTSDSESSLNEIIDEKCRVYIPWVNTHRAGKVRRVRSFIIGVEFDKPLKEDMVKLIAKMEPNPDRHFKPSDNRKYNRIIPLTQT